MLIKVCNFFELPDLKPVKFKVNNKEVILVRINDKVYATEPECPHKGGSLEYSDINAELKRIRCHLHGFGSGAHFCTLPVTSKHMFLTSLYPPSPHFYSPAPSRLHPSLQGLSGETLTPPHPLVHANISLPRLYQRWQPHFSPIPLPWGIHGLIELRCYLFL